jgi:tRNA dimethylallyltransferase
VLPEVNKPVVVILGPTAVGKTEFAISLANRLGGEIVSVDSRLLYREMDIGTAKPTIQERKQIPHHLVDVADLNEIWSLAKFKNAARQAIDEIHKRGNLPLLVGGTGQYIRAVIDNWVIPRVEPDQQMRQVLEDWSQDIGAAGLHCRLSLIDPKAAEKIDYRNLRRTIRALEVIFHTGRLFSEQVKRDPSPYNVLKIGLDRPRDDLYNRIDARIMSMLEAGLIEEVRSLLDQGYTPDLPGFSAIGYREIAAFLRGEISLDEAISLIKRQTRVFVRRQANWFKKDDPTIHWFNAQIVEAADVESYLNAWLNADG